MTTFSSRLKQAMAERDISVSAVAREMDVSVQSVYRWQDGQIPRADRIERLADFLGVSVQWLFSGDEPPKTVTSEEGRIVVPLLEVEHSAGNGSVLASSDVMRLLELEPSWAHEKLTCLTATQNLALIHVAGDSMEPTLHHSDVVLIDRGFTRIVRDGIYATTFDDDLYIKRFQKIPGGTVEMISDNPVYRSREFDPADESFKFSVLGLALWVWQGKKLF